MSIPVLSSAALACSAVKPISTMSFTFCSSTPLFAYSSAVDTQRVKNHPIDFAVGTLAHMFETIQRNSSLRQHTTRRLSRCHCGVGRAALVQFRACCSYSLRLLMYCFATTASCGSSGSGHCNNSCRLRRAVLMPSAGDHSSLRMSKQIAPVWLDIFGCHTCRCHVFCSAVWNTLGITPTTHKTHSPL